LTPKTVAPMAEVSKPMVLIAVTPVAGHVAPLRAIAKELITRSYDVTFVTGSEYEERIKEIGATYVPLSGTADFTEKRIMEIMKSLTSDRPPSETDLYQRVWVDVIPDQWASIQKGLKLMIEKNPLAHIVVVHECAFRGTLPGYLGAPGVQANGYMGIGINPFFFSSIDAAPWVISGRSMPFDNSADGRKRNKALNEQLRKNTEAPEAKFQEVLHTLGARKSDYSSLDAVYHVDRFVQMCTPSMEYPIADRPPNIRFAGGLMPTHRDTTATYPKWWEDISVNRQGKRIIFVAQGTVAIDSDELIKPTLEAFRDKEDFIVIAALGKKGMSMKAGTPVPQNARIEDYIPYDDVLRYADIFVTNGGYGAIQQGLSNGVPMIVGGRRADKPENAMRVEWAGAGINLKTHVPSPQDVYEAAQKIIEEPRFKERALEIKTEIASYDPISIVIENIEHVANVRNVTTR
jgi:UDP:flavonoid glycosyltransferase YjiC (YdhE family)